MDSYDQATGEVIEQRQLPAMPDSRPQNLIFASANPGEVFGALCAMQGTMDSPKRTKTASVKGRTRGGSEYEYKYAYAPLDEIINTVKKPMADAGLAYRQFLASRDGQWVMRTLIAHKTGEWFGCDYPIFWDESRGMQGFASGVTYARRYGLMLALGIAAEDDDDANVADGNAAKVTDKPSRGRTAQGSAPAATRVAEPPAPAPQRAAQTADMMMAPGNVGDTALRQAPATEEDREQARNNYADMFQAIENAASIGEVRVMTASSDWTDLQDTLKWVEGETKGANIFKRLEVLAEKVRDSFMVAGEMG